MSGEFVANALADLVSREPVDFFVGEGVRRDDVLSGFEDLFRGDFGAVDVAIGEALNVGELDVEADETVLTGDNHDGSVGFGVNGAAVTDIGEVGERDNVEDSPDEIGVFAFHDEAELTAHPGVSAVATDDIFCVDGLGSTGGFFEGGVVVRFGHEVGRAKEAVLDFVAKLFDFGGFVGEVAEDDLNGIGGVVLHLGLVNFDLFGENSVFNLDVVALLLEIVLEVSLDEALVQDNLCKPRQTRRHVRNSASPANNSISIGIPEADL